MTKIQSPSVTKSELISRIAKRFPQLYHKDVETLVKTVLSEIIVALEQGNRVELRGFGAFSVRKRNPRVARNPRNGTPVTVGERYSIYYRAGKELRERVNH